MSDSRSSLHARHDGMQRKGNNMTAHLTTLYAAILGLVMIALMAMVITMRAKTHISIMDGGNIQLAERMRRHGNFIENVPMALILMALAETSGASPTIIHASGIILVLSRLIHPFGIQNDNSAARARIFGATGTMIAMLISIGAILWQFMSNQT